MISSNRTDSDDPFNLKRFLDAQEDIYGQALTELKNGRKRTHWMWFIFPQLDGLGYSSMTKHYSIKSPEEAQQYLNHPVLGKRLRECAEAVLAIEDRTISEIFGSPDYLKLNSSLTLFASLAKADPVFTALIDKYYHGKEDSRTLRLLNKT